MSALIDWNMALKLGLTGLAAAILGVMWFILRGMLHQGVPRPWFVALGLLFLVSVITMVGSQLTVESKLSWGSADDDEK